MRGVHLFVPMLHRHDAVGEHTRTLRDGLIASGVRSQIYTELPDPATVDDTRHYLEYESESEPGDVLVYQFATESAIAQWLATRPEPVVINYHSITPPEYFGPWNNGITRGQVAALGELALLAPRAALGIADSAFVAGELRRAGCGSTTVVPVAGVPDPPVEPSPGAMERLRARRRGDGQRWLSVGRLAPNKAHHHTIAALFVARQEQDPGAGLTVVGSPTEPSYAAALRRYAAELGMAEAVEFVSGITDDELAAHYRSADVLVMLSDHEGFGVPLVEAMGHGLPVVAFDAGAVSEVLGGAGVLLARKNPRHVASEVARILADPAEVERLRRAGTERFAGLDLGKAENLLIEAVRGVSAPVSSAT
jgi:glycosyltransferase involved in cell wall biosynthesis